MGAKTKNTLGGGEGGGLVPLSPIPTYSMTTRACIHFVYM